MLFDSLVALIREAKRKGLDVYAPLDSFIASANDYWFQMLVRIQSVFNILKMRTLEYLMISKLKIIYH